MCISTKILLNVCSLKYIFIYCRNLVCLHLSDLQIYTDQYYSKLILVLDWQQPVFWYLTLSAWILVLLCNLRSFDVVLNFFFGLLHIVEPITATPKVPFNTMMQFYHCLYFGTWVFWFLFHPNLFDLFSFQAGFTATDQMDLLVEQVKMLAGEIAFSTSTLKRLVEQSVDDPESTKPQVPSFTSSLLSLVIFWLMIGHVKQWFSFDNFVFLHLSCDLINRFTIWSVKFKKSGDKCVPWSRKSLRRVRPLLPVPLWLICNRSCSFVLLLSLS